MPKAARAKITSTPRTIEHLEEKIEIDDRMLEESKLEPGWRAKVEEFEADIWTAQDLMPALLAKECLAYLYRLEPEVFNSAGKGSNIGKYQIPVTIEQITKTHGGGKYKLWIKRGPRNMQQEIFTINDVLPIFQPGQTQREGKPLASNSEPTERKSETAEVVKMLLDSQKQQPGATQALQSAIEVIGTASTNALKIQGDAAAAVANSPTGNKLMDELVPLLLKRFTEPAPPPQDPLTMFDRVAGIIEKMTPKPAPVAPNPEASGMDPLEQLSFVKELTGAESIRDLFKGGGGNKGPDPWFALGTQAIAALPAIIGQVRQMQHENFNRQLYLAQTQGRTLPETAGATPATRAPVASRGAVVNFPPAPIAPLAPPAIEQPEQQRTAQPQPQEELIARIVFDIDRYYRAGYDGEVTAVNLKMNLPEGVVLLGPVLANQEQLTALVQGIPQLTALSQDADWPEFLHDFLEEMKTEQAEPENTGAEAAKPN